MLAALGTVNRTFQAPNVFNTEQERFDQHFDLLQRAHIPEGASYQLYKKSIAHADISEIGSYHHYFLNAQRLISNLRSKLGEAAERLSELQQLEHVAERNRVALKVLGQLGPSDSSLRVTLEFDRHPCFGVATVKRS